MCKANSRSAQAIGANALRERGFWSVDAAFALVLSVAMFAIFSAMLHSAGMTVVRGAEDASGALLSARFSSYALERMEKEEQIGLASVLERTGKSYASLRSRGAFDYAGETSGAVYCTERLYVNGNTMVKMEACIG